MEMLKFLFCVLFFGSIAFAAPADLKKGAQSNTRGIPVSASELLYARPFTLTTGYKFTWSHDKPIVDSGVIVVLRVNPELVVPTNAPEPILYAGDRMVHRLNFGHQSGHVIGIIPGAFDFGAEPVWFGAPHAPGREKPEAIKSEHAMAKTKIKPFAASSITRASREPVQAPDFAALLRGEIAELVLQYSPHESDLARKWRLPEAVAKPNPARPTEKGKGGKLQ